MRDINVLFIFFFSKNLIQKISLAVLIYPHD